MGSRELHARARAMVDAFEANPREQRTDFERLACDLARFQAEAIPGYARLCRARSIDVASLTRIEDIPAVPTDAFKLVRVATFEREETTLTFRTSGTTIGTRGTHEMRDGATYDRAAIAFGRWSLVRDITPKRIPIVVLGPPPGVANDSSLGHMCSAFITAFGEDAPQNETWVIDEGVIDLSAFDTRVAVAHTRNEPMLVLATSFALVHLLEALGDDTFALPRGSRVMHTGGFKGKSREVAPAQLRREVARVFAIDERAIVMEYGMTELSSQFYEQTLFSDAREGIFSEPPWARVLAVDPETLAPVADGEIGIAKIIDAMNIDSAVAVLTQDRVRRVSPNGFELLGRAAGAPPRGCSIALDELLGSGTQ